MQVALVIATEKSKSRCRNRKSYKKQFRCDIFYLQIRISKIVRLFLSDIGLYLPEKTAKKLSMQFFFHCPNQRSLTFCLQLQLSGCKANIFLTPFLRAPHRGSEGWDP